MPFRFNSATGEIVCDTAAQMAALVHALQGNRAAGARATSGIRSPVHSGVTVSDASDDGPTLSSVLTGLQKRSRQYMEILAANPNGVLDSKLAELLKLKKPAYVTAVVASINNALKKTGLPFDQVVQRQRHFNGGGRDYLSLIRPERYEEVKKSIKSQ